MISVVHALHHSKSYASVLAFKRKTFVGPLAEQDSDSQDIVVNDRNPRSSYQQGWASRWWEVETARPTQSGPLSQTLFHSGQVRAISHNAPCDWGALHPYSQLDTSTVDDILACAAKKQTGISLKYILDFGSQPLERQLLLSSRFLHQELPIRLSHRITELHTLPHGLSEVSQVLRVKAMYCESFMKLRAFPYITGQEDQLAFTRLLQALFKKHGNVVPAIAKGVETFRHQLQTGRHSASTLDEMPEIHTFLDGFFLSRIAIRFLVGNHLALNEQSGSPDIIGLIHTRCFIMRVIEDAVCDARSVCIRNLGSAPQVSIYGSPDLTLAYVPSHLHHMVFELVKNSLRAVQERYESSEDEPPPINVVLAAGQEDVTIKVSDMGGGIPRSGLKRIWTYLYTTARNPLPDVEDVDEPLPVVLAGYGCGLPLSRMYARYFGGDMQIISMEGYGTDAFLHLNRLGNDEEPLPGQLGASKLVRE